MRGRPLGVLAVVIGCSSIAACDGSNLDRVLGPEAVVPSIIDGRDAASRHVFFLSPIERTDFTRTAPFNAHLRLRIEICALDAVDPLNNPAATATAACVAERPLVAWFEQDAASDGASFITLNTQIDGAPAPDSSYSVGWKTTSDLAGGAYRVHVLVNRTLVAYADIVLASNSAQIGEMGDNYGDVAGRNIPIKLVAEVGAGCDGLDCYAFFVTCEGGTFRTEHAGAVLPPGFAAECGTSDEPEGWWLYQERVEIATGSRCLPTDWVQFDPCYLWELVREDGTRYQREFVEGKHPVVTYCIEADALTWRPVLTGFRSAFPYDDFEEMTLTPEAEDPFSITCPYSGSPAPSGALGWASQAVRSVAAFIGVRPALLYAGDTSTSTRTSKFSHFARVLATMFSEVSGDGQTAVAGTTLPQPLVVRVSSIAHHEGDEIAYANGTPEPGSPLGGIPVTFTVTSGGGTVSDGSSSGTELVVHSDDDGYARVWWTLGSQDGSQTVEASGTEMNHTFTADAVSLFAHFLPPLAASAGSWTPLYESFAPSFLVCPGRGPSSVPCTATRVAAIGPDQIKIVEQDGRKFYQAGWKPRDSAAATDAYYHVQVVLSTGFVAGSSVPIYVSSGGKDQLLEGVYQTKSSSNVEIKVRLTRAQP